MDNPAHPPWTDFAHDVADAVAHLYDFPYLQTHPLTRLLPGGTRGWRETRGKLLRQQLLEAIAALDPGVDERTTAHAKRIHRLLALRYIEGLTPEVVAQELALSRSAYYRDHRLGLDALTTLLWDCMMQPDGAPAPCMAAEARSRW